MKLIKAFAILSLSFFILIFIPQFYRHARAVFYYTNYVSRMDMTQRKSYVWGETYDYAMKVKDNLPGEYSARYVTDEDLTDDPGMIYQRGMVFFIYPINIFMNLNKNPDLLLYFRKENAKNRIPEGYRPILIFDDHNLVAIKHHD